MIWVNIKTIVLIAIIALMVGMELGYAVGRRERKK